jgi:hypothetical protein
LVERNLAKVEVASSSLVVRSEKVSSSTVEWPRGEATDCKSVYTGSNPVSTSIAWFHWAKRAIGAVVARFPDTEEVTGSNPVSPTSTFPKVSKDRAPQPHGGGALFIQPGLRVAGSRTATPGR